MFSFVAVPIIRAMIFPFFTDFLGLLGDVSFWPLTVNFPTGMHIVRHKFLNSQPSGHC
ncbi:hypothetical protein LINGRAPRIM_LOCUS1239 [Linum grandiflorum]